MKKTGKLLVISGFSGAGKGTVSRALVDRYGYSLSVSATTRAPRAGEMEGREYTFKTEEEFLKLIEEDGFIEYACYVGHYYGTPRRFVEEELAAGHVVILEIEVQGAMKIRQQYPDAILLFISAPSARILEKRLAGRGTESPEVMRKRLERAVQEAEDIEAYDYIVSNAEGELEECIELVHTIVESEKHRVAVCGDFIESMKTGLRHLTEEIDF